MTIDELLHNEIGSLLDDLKKEYEQSGRKVTGNFAKGLEAIYEPNKATIRGYTYLAGRGPTQNGHRAGTPYLIDAIEQWIKDKGITAKAQGDKKPISQRSLAYAISKKIHEKGTNREEWLKIYEKVITPDRINQIINHISTAYADQIVMGLAAQLKILAKNI